MRPKMTMPAIWWLSPKSNVWFSSIFNLDDYLL
jgi:hypothetical protein